jgi:hypothetical protein
MGNSERRSSHKMAEDRAKKVLLRRESTNPFKHLGIEALHLLIVELR